jgi:hypothetical protein
MGFRGQPSLHRVGYNPYIAVRGKIDSTADIRVWVGLAYDIDSQNSDSPSGDVAAFRYSTAAGDTAWMCVTKDGSTINTAGSGVAPSTTATQLLEIQVNSGANVVFKIDGTTVCTVTQNLPRSSAAMAAIFVGETQTNAAKMIYLHSIYTEEDK